MSTKVAVVTGGNKGIGYAIVRGLCQQLKGYDVLLTARDEGRGQAAVEQLKKEGVNPKFYPLDLSNTATIANLAKHLRDTYGGLDILVNNAGIAYKGTSTAPFSEQAEVTMATNYTGTVNVCNALFPLLKNGARVVHVSSISSTMSLAKCSTAIQDTFRKMDNMQDLEKHMAEFVKSAAVGKHTDRGYSNSGYGMSKIGVTVMTAIQQNTIDQDQARSDILVNSCCPGYVNTDMTSHKGPLSVEQGADTPLYLATLPPGATSPKGEFCSKRQIVNWRET